MSQHNAKVAVLFSGGIDSTVITALADRYVWAVNGWRLLNNTFSHIPIHEPIDLLNVAFENPRKLKIQHEGNMGGPTRKKKPYQGGPIECSYMVPDRVSGLQALVELRRLNPNRIWNFVRKALLSLVA